MSIQKASTITFFRYLAIFCAITMGFFSIVATSEDDAKDALGIEIPFDDEEVEMELETVTVEKGQPDDQMQLMDEVSDCSDQTVRSLLTQAIAEFNAENDLGADVSVGDIDTIVLDYVGGSYTVSNVVGDISNAECTVSIDGAGEDFDATITQTADMTPTDTEITLTIDPGAETAINHYLLNIDESFKVCGSCTNTEDLTSYTIDFDLDIGIFISGEI